MALEQHDWLSAMTNPDTVLPAGWPSPEEGAPAPQPDAGPVQPEPRLARNLAGTGLSGEVPQPAEGSLHGASLHPDHAIAGVAAGVGGHDVGGHAGLAAGISN